MRRSITFAFVLKKKPTSRLSTPQSKTPTSKSPTIMGGGIKPGFGLIGFLRPALERKLGFSQNLFLQPTHTYWCGPPMNNSYQQGALLELVQLVRAINCNQCWYSSFIGDPHRQVWVGYQVPTILFVQLLSQSFFSLRPLEYILVYLVCPFYGRHNIHYLIHWYLESIIYQDQFSESCCYHFRIFWDREILGNTCEWYNLFQEIAPPNKVTLCN